MQRLEGLPIETGSDLKVSLLAIKQAAFVCIVTNPNSRSGISRQVFLSVIFLLFFSIISFVRVVLGYAGFKVQT